MKKQNGVADQTVSLSGYCQDDVDRITGDRVYCPEENWVIKWDYTKMELCGRGGYNVAYYHYSGTIIIFFVHQPIDVAETVIENGKIITHYM